MTATHHTEHYGLSQYTDNDHPTYTGDYNGDMAKIDSAIHAASRSGLPAVTHTADLTGDGSTGNPLGVAGVIARSEDIPSLDGYATTESVTQAIAAAIADRPAAGDIKAGAGINIKTSGNQVTISSDVSALTSRIASLEATVSRLTANDPPSTTGLTATELDTQYFDDYNIVRGRTPTRSNESKEPRHE